MFAQPLACYPNFIYHIEYTSDFIGTIDAFWINHDDPECEYSEEDWQELLAATWKYFSYIAYLAPIAGRLYPLQDGSYVLLEPLP